MNILENANNMEEYAISLRRRFHRIPEQGMGEFKTKKLIAIELERHDISYHEIGKTGVMITLGQGDRTIALRADMDGIHIDEKNDIEYKSLNKGYMHACGHDGHMAALLTAAIILKEHESELTCKVKIIFQPSEENCLGADMIIKSGVLNDVSAIYGLHLFSFIPYGCVNIQSGVRMAITDNFKITVNGKSGHAANPNLCVDATVAASSLVMNLQSVISRELGPCSDAVLSIGRFDSGTAHNIISEKAVLEGTVRAFSMEDSDKMEASIKRISDMTAKTFRATAEVEYRKSMHPQVMNDEMLVDELMPIAKECFGDKLIKYPAIMLGEDFSNYQKKIPGVFAFVGAGDIDGTFPPNHNDRFNIDERALMDAVIMYLVFAFSNVKKK